MHVNYNCLNSNSCLLNQTERTQLCDLVMLDSPSGIPWRNETARNPATQRENKKICSKLLFCWLRNSFLLGIPPRFSVCSLNMKINILNISLFFFSVFHRRTWSCLNRLSFLRVSSEKARIKTIFGLFRRLHDEVVACVVFWRRSERHDIKLIILSWIYWTNVGDSQQRCEEETKNRENFRQ